MSQASLSVADLGDKPEEVDQPGKTAEHGDSHFNNQQLQSMPLEYLAGLNYATLVTEPIEQEVFCESVILDAETEWKLFRQMNLAFKRASDLRETAADDPLYFEAEETLHELVARGHRIRNGLLLIYSKLAQSICRRFVNGQMTFDELTSEAHETLLHAIAKFNPDFGFRFSTYATHAIRRRLFRYVNKRQVGHEVCVDWQSQGLIDPHRWTYEYERNVTDELQIVDRLLLQLSPRERDVIRSRFGWGRDFACRTLQEIATEQGVSRERIRQLESRALDKLRRFARHDQSTGE